MSGGAVNFERCGSVLVTGACSGLGLQFVTSLATRGFFRGKIIATCMSLPEAQKLQELAKQHPNVHIVSLDIVSPESIDQAAQEVDRLLGDEGLNCLINNAGINLLADFHSVTVEQMMQNFRVNAVGPLMVTKAFLPLLKKAASREGAAGGGGGGGGVGGGGGGAPGGTMGIHRAAVINVTSLMGSVELNCGYRANAFKGYPYRASKCALNMITRSMAVDLGPDGILCMVIHPGWARTTMGGAEAPMSPEESIAAMLSVIGRLTDKDNGCFLDFKGEPLPW